MHSIMFHPLPLQPNYVLVHAKVFPSLKKTSVHHVFVVLKESAARVAVAYCACPAGVSGCCNHVTALLYTLEDYVRRGLREDEKQGCTERLMLWNRPRKKYIDARPTDEVHLEKKSYGVHKRQKVRHINKWDCRSVSSRQLHPKRPLRLWQQLFEVQRSKLRNAEKDVASAETGKQHKAASRKRALLKRYGSSFFIQLLDNEPCPDVNMAEKKRTKRIARALKKKALFVDKQRKH